MNAAVCDLFAQAPARHEHGEDREKEERDEQGVAEEARESIFEDRVGADQVGNRGESDEEKRGTDPSDATPHRFRDQDASHRKRPTAEAQDSSQADETELDQERSTPNFDDGREPEVRAQALAARRQRGTEEGEHDR